MVAELAPTHRRRASRLPRYWPWLALLALVVLCRGLVWMVAVPMFQAPDEASHYAYVESIGRGDGLGTVQSRRGSAGLDEALDATGFSATIFRPQYVASFDATEMLRARAQLRDATERRDEVGELVSTAAGYPPTYYALAAVAERSTSSASLMSSAYSVRFVSVLLATLTVFAHFVFFRLLFDSPVEQLAATALTALLPMYAFMESAINPDVLVSLVASALLALTMWVLRQGATWPAAVAIGAATGVGFITKPTVLLLAPAVGVAWFAALWMHRIGWRASVLRSAGALGAAALFALPWLLRGTSSGGVSGGVAAQPVEVTTETLRTYWTTLKQLLWDRDFSSFWASFGYMDTGADASVYLFIGVLCAVSAAGLLFAAINARRIDLRWVVVVLSIIPLTLALLWIEFVRFTGNVEPAFIQGRYLFPVLPPIVALLLAGWTRPMRSEGVRATVSVLAVVAMAGFHLVTLVRYVIPRYYL